MRLLSFLRHAKSNWDDPTLQDVDRPLSPRGRKAASLLGRYIIAEGLVPDLVLSSVSIRTRQTCELAFAGLTPAPKIVFEDNVYLASADQLIELIRATEASVPHLMIVGHNPGLQRLALGLVGTGPARQIASLAEKLPTAGLVVLKLPGEAWNAAVPGVARLMRFVTPRCLAGPS